MIKPAYISVIRDDEDIVANNLIYYYNLGIRDFFILLHKATDELNNAIYDIKCKLNAEFRIFRHDKDEHYHDKDCKILSDAARAEGFDWIIGTDADELLILKKHKTIQDFLKDFDNTGYCSLLFEWYHYPPTHEVFAPENVFTEFTYRLKVRTEQYKAIGKFDDKMAYVPGLHFIANSSRQILIPFDVARYSHFPDRNCAQFEKKYLIQKENWLKRYGQYPLADKIDADPEFLKKFWESKLIKDTSNLIYNPIKPEIFNV